jgi:hypothetical protein
VRTMGTCMSCAQERRVYKNRKFGIALCMPCKVRIHMKNPSKHEVCSDCSRLRFPAARKEGKSPLCPTCSLHYKCKICKKRFEKRLIHKVCEECKPVKYQGRCSSCDSVLPPKKVTSLCRNCYNREYVKNKSLEICVFCNKLSAVAVRLGDGTISCGNCRKKHLAPHDYCSVCGVHTYTFYNKREGKNVCGRCDTAIREGKI